jgi:energy-coupling factor transporter ATP-binding protein EcfA2
MAKIVKLDVTNFKRISIVEINAKGESIIIGGRNAQGKSSVLDAIEALLRGGKAFPDMPVKTGEKKAVIRCELDDGIVIERGITEAGTASLKITTADGMSPQHPQAWLDRKLSAATCDPLAFIRAAPKAQAAELRRLTGVDTDSLDAERATVYAQRTQDGRQEREAGALLSRIPVPGEDVPDEPVSASAIAGELEAARLLNIQVGELNKEAEEHDNDAANAPTIALETLNYHQDQAIEYREQAQELLRQAQVLEDRAKGAEKQGKDEHDVMIESGKADAKIAAALRAQAEAITVPDIDEIKQRLDEVDAINNAVQQGIRYREAQDEAAKWADKVAAGTSRITEIDAERIEILSGADWPVEGLGIADGAVTFQEVPLSQASQAEQLRVGMALALAGKPEIPVALIRDGSHLDDESLALLADYAQEAGAQVWIERVGSHDAGAVVIEDGTVVETKNQNTGS